MTKQKGLKYINTTKQDGGNKMDTNEIKTVGRGPAVMGIDATIEGWKYFVDVIKEGFASVDKAYNPVQEMLSKEHETYLKIVEDNDCSDELRKDAARNARESSAAAQTVASNRMADVLKIVGAFATVTAAALGGTQYIKYFNR